MLPLFFLEKPLINFDKIVNESRSKFIRNDVRMLESIYGTTDLEPFWIADMDFEVAEVIEDELHSLANRARFAYEFTSEAVFKAIVAWYKRRHELVLNASQFTQVPGVLSGISLLIRELTQPGEAILIQPPVYHQFKKVIESANRKVLRSPLIVNNGQYQMDFEDLENNFASGTIKVMLLCNPHNPVGRVWSKEELARLLKLAQAYGVFIISDEIHSDIIYGERKFQSMTDFKEKNVAALIGSPSKTFGLQSIASGYIYTLDNKLSRKLTLTLNAMYLHSDAISNYVTIAAYSKGEHWLEDLLKYLQNSIDWIEQYLNQELPQVHMYPVEGTYQIWLNFEATGRSVEEIKQALVQARMGLTPGNWFESDNDFLFRMNIAASLKKIQTVFSELKKALSNEPENR